jgi:adenine phosphoribosyltransferase
MFIDVKVWRFHGMLADSPRTAAAAAIQDDIFSLETAHEIRRRPRAVLSLVERRGRPLHAGTGRTGLLHHHGRRQGIAVTGLSAADLRRAVVDVPDFPKPGILFRDIAPLLRTHLADTMQALDGLLTDADWKHIDAIAGIESRGFILGAALALKRGKGFVLVRKKGKLPPPVVDVSYDLEYGSGVLEMQRGEGRLLLVDDVLATGGTLTAAAELCLKAGYEVTALSALIDLHIIADYRWRGLPLRAVINY